MWEKERALCTHCLLNFIHKELSKKGRSHMQYLFLNDQLFISPLWSLIKIAHSKDPHFYKRPLTFTIRLYKKSHNINYTQNCCSKQRWNQSTHLYKHGKAPIKCFRTCLNWMSMDETWSVVTPSCDRYSRFRCWNQYWMYTHGSHSIRYQC